MKLLIIGNRGESDVGAFFEKAAFRLGLDTHLVEVRSAYDAPALIKKINWWCRSRRPTKLKSFGALLLKEIADVQPDVILAVGIVPLQKQALERMRLQNRKTKFYIYLTDDPWSRVHRGNWFLETLNLYDQVFSVRQANLDDLKKMGCKRVSYLPFGFDPDVHYLEPSVPADVRKKHASDVLFIGGADKDRLPYVKALLRAGCRVALFGPYWNRYAEARSSWQGYADAKTMREAVQAAQLVLGLVRRSNRDGNSMRTFEVPAMGGLLLPEDTPEHRVIFDIPEIRVPFFDSVSSMVEQVKALLQNDLNRSRLSDAMRKKIVLGRNTYQDRLSDILMLNKGTSA